MSASENNQAYILYSCGCRPIPQSELIVDFSKDYNRLPMPPNYEQKVVDVWAARCAQNKNIWNGSKFRFHALEKDETGRSGYYLVVSLLL